MEQHKNWFWWWLVAAMVCGISLGLLVLWWWTQKTAVPFQDVAPKPTGSVAGVITTLEPVSLVFPTITLVPTTSQEISVPLSPIVTESSALVSATLTPTPVIGLQNPSFNQGLEKWQTKGAVKVFSVDATDRGDLPQNLKNFVRLSSETNLDWLGAHQLTQQFQVAAGTNSIEFWYRLWTEETELGFDNPCFIVLINGQPVMWFAAPMAWREVWYPAWQQIKVPIPKIGTNTVILSFMAGQTGDQLRATWVDLAGINTSPLEVIQEATALNSQLKLTFLTPEAIGVSQKNEAAEVLPDFPGLLEPINKPQFGNNLSLLLPELGEEIEIQNSIRLPDGKTFETAINSPEFWPFIGALYQLKTSQYNLQEKLKTYPTTPMHLLLKSLKNQVQQLLPVDFEPG